MPRTFTAAFALLLTLLSGCAVDKYPVATGGSRSDGTVKLSYQVGQWEQPQVHMDAAQSQPKRNAKYGVTQEHKRLAVARCNVRPTMDTERAPLLS